jgi:hypothetical protein
VDKLPTLGPLESIAILRLNVVFREVCNAGRLQIWHLFIDMHLILLRVGFEDGSSISVWKTRATRHNNHTTENRKVLKKSTRQPTSFHTPLFSNSHVRSTRSRLGVLAHARVSRRLEHIQKR